MATGHELESSLALPQCTSLHDTSLHEETSLGSPKHFNQLSLASSAGKVLPAEELPDLEKNSVLERAQWVLNVPEPPGVWPELKHAVRSRWNEFLSITNQPVSKCVFLVLRSIFPILDWGRKYKVSKFKNDVLAGLTLASLCIPQSIGYATLANLDPQYGLYTSVVPPVIYAVMGTSRHIAIGPVAVVSLLLSSMVQKLQDPLSDPLAYTKLVLTATFFTGVFQAAFGLLRLGFLVDFLSHAAIVGFMGGAAIVIGLQQLKGLLGISHFTTKTDLVSVMEALWTFLQHPWNPRNFLLGSSFLIFIMVTRFLGRKKKKLFWLPAIAPLLCVVLSTGIVYLTGADKNGVKIIKHIQGGLNPISLHELQFSDARIGEVAKVGLIVAVVALAEAIAVGRSFASIKGYHLDGNKEMVSMGFMNIIGSFTSCYVATGSFSRSAVNFSAGCETAMSNIVMAITVVISLELLTKLLYYTPIAILASIILSALPGLVNVAEAYSIWKVDKLDFVVCIGAFFGVLFASVEMGLLVAVTLSFVKILLISIRPGTETLGRIPGSDTFCDIDQYPMAVKSPGVLIIRIKSALLCFANANFVRDRIMKWIANERKNSKENGQTSIQLLILDMSNLLNIDTSGIASLEELHKDLVSQGLELAIANPRWQVIHKLRLVNFVEKIGKRIFLSVGEAVDTICLSTTKVSSV